MTKDLASQFARLAIMNMEFNIKWAFLQSNWEQKSHQYKTRVRGKSDPARVHFNIRCPDIGEWNFSIPLELAFELEESDWVAHLNKQYDEAFGLISLSNEERNNENDY